MKIPERLAYLLERDQQLDGATKISISQFQPSIDNSGLIFFPEYTNHDMKHIEGVLNTATSLIADDSWSTFTPSDAAVLILSVLLHDCAMHISEDGFFQLINTDQNSNPYAISSDQPWSTLWEDFISEARRFDGRQLIRLFGSNQPINRPPKDANQLTKVDRMLIGEFLRRHHARLAQEIALFGVPTKGGKPLILEGFSELKHIPALAGIVARSHGEKVRAFLPWLQKHFDVRQHKGIHAVFLMSLLRIADYLKVEAERAPSQMLKVRKLTSPISQGEWAAHAAIQDVRNTHEDPEAIYIEALPPNIETFKKVKSWLTGIQHELDSSWAVLGEVYGRYGELNKLKILLRRVRSNLDDPASLSSKVDYLPINAAFKAADADLLKLLIEPLYGNKPEVGLRELIQNAVDAVRELNQYRHDLKIGENIDRPSQDGDVVVKIEKNPNDQHFMEISDRGIGMTPEIITDYFLTAGASFRRSDAWKKNFENDEGNSKVLRAGRFGIGALAAFLLGPEISVTTRHISSPTGVQFKATVESDSIELKKIQRPIGTTIQISISKHLADKLSQREFTHAYFEDDYEGKNWDWYCLQVPSVKRTAFSKKLEQKYHLPEPTSQLSEPWRRVTHPEYDAILWTYSKVPKLVCNGIVIMKDRSKTPFSKAGLSVPNLCVFDPNGKLPLNLQRSALTENVYPFHNDLLNDVILDFIAFSLVYGPTKLPENLQEASLRLFYPGTSRTNYNQDVAIDWYTFKNGFGYADPTFLSNENTTMLVTGVPTSLKKIPYELLQQLPTVSSTSEYTYGRADSFFRKVAEFGYYSGEGSIEKMPDGDADAESVIGQTIRKGARILVSNSVLERGGQGGNYKITRIVFKALQNEWTIGKWHLFQIGNCPESKFDFKEAIKRLDEKDDNFTIAGEIYLSGTENREPSPIAKKWLEILKATEIPFDLEERAEKFKDAYKLLAPYILSQEK
jgi:molecular chaperone HtpG